MPEHNAIYDDMLLAEPAPWELEALAAKLAIARLPPQPPVEIKGNPELAAAAKRAQRFQERWEKTMASVLGRYWERRQALILAKVSSVQFRRGTPLVGSARRHPAHLPVLAPGDEAAWDRELTEGHDPGPDRPPRRGGSRPWRSVR
jgi:hypothetical protein